MSIPPSDPTGAAGAPLPQQLAGKWQRVRREDAGAGTSDISASATDLEGVDAADQQRSAAERDPDGRRRWSYPQAGPPRAAGERPENDQATGDPLSPPAMPWRAGEEREAPGQELDLEG
jgi:hypothetical protein